VSVVANVAINVDSRQAVTKLRQVQQGAQATSQAVDKLNATNDALAASFTKSGKPIQTATNGMRYFVDATGRARKENGQFVTTAEAAAAGLQKQGKAAQQAGASVSNFGGTIRGLIGSFAAIQAARFVFVKTAELESQARSLQVLTGSAEKAGQIIKDLQRLGAVTPFTSSEQIDSAKRLQAFGVETNKVVETTRRLADVSGATGAELQGLVTAYGQVQAKGRLQGEELLQFQERGVALQQELRKQYNLSGEEFQDALQKGKISAEAVEFAIQNLTNAGGKYANGAIAQSDTLNGRFSTLQDGIEGLARTIGTALTPAIKAVLNEAIFAINTINQLLNTGARAKSFGLDQRGRQQILRQAQDEAKAIVEGRRIANPFERNRQFQEIAAQRERDLIEAFGIRTGQVKPQVTAPQGQRALPALGAGTSGGRKGKSDADKAAEKAAREAERLAQELERSLQLGDQLGTQFARQAALLFEASEIEQKRLQIQFDYEDRAKQIAELKNTEQQTNLNQLNDEIRRLEIIDLQTEALKKQAEEADKLFKKAMEGSEFGVAGEGTVASGLTDAISKLKEDLNPIKLATETIVNGATAIGEAFSTAFGEVITGAKSTQEALADAFKSIGQAFISMALEIIAKQMTLIILQTILNALSGGAGGAMGTANKNLSGAGALKSPIPGLKVGGYAEGGFVTGPTNALIGEGGESEYVIPASKMSAAMSRYSRGARGESVIPGNGATPEGGGAATATMEPIDVRYTVERINSVDYVTADQFQAGMQQAAAQGAKQGEQRALSTLRQNTNVRRSVGI
jgi:tape measure domain-containing protein